MDERAAETHSRTYTVEELFESRYEQHDVASVERAIETVKRVESTDPIPSSTKILAPDEAVVYDSNRNGAIEDWEREWKQEKLRLTNSEDPHVCPYDSNGCVEGSLCIQCEMDRQMAEFSTDGR